MVYVLLYILFWAVIICTLYYVYERVKTPFFTSEINTVIRSKWVFQIRDLRPKLQNSLGWAEIIPCLYLASDGSFLTFQTLIWASEKSHRNPDIPSLEQAFSFIWSPGKCMGEGAAEKADGAKTCDVFIPRRNHKLALSLCLWTKLSQLQKYSTVRKTQSLVLFQLWTFVVPCLLEISYRSKRKEKYRQTQTLLNLQRRHSCRGNEWIIWHD